MLRKFPTLKIALSEGGVGWLPYFLDKIDLVYRSISAWTGQDYGDRLPSDVFRERIVTCFLDDRSGSKLRNARHRLDHLGMRLPALRLRLAPVPGDRSRNRWPA